LLGGRLRKPLFIRVTDILCLKRLGMDRNKRGGGGGGKRDKGRAWGQFSRQEGGT